MKSLQRKNKLLRRIKTFHFPTYDDKEEEKIAIEDIAATF